MGNKLQGRETISYKSTTGQIFEIKVNDLQGAKKFPKIPKREEVIKQYDQWRSEVILEDHDIKLLKTIELKYKYRICHVHNQIIQKIQYQKSQEQYSNQIYIDQLLKTIQRLFDDYNDVDLCNISKSLSDSTCIELKVDLMKKMNLVSFLCDRLNLLEETSRITNNFRDQIRILELFQIILNYQNINLKLLFYEPKCLKSILQNFHPIEPKVNGLVFKIIAGQNGFSWKENYFQNIQLAFESLSNCYSFKNKFQIFIGTIYYSKNLIMIYHIIKFIFRYLYSLDEQYQVQVTTELNETKVNEKSLEEVFKQIKLRIKLKLYKNEDCTYEAIRNQLSTFEHPLIAYNQEETRMTKQFASFIDSSLDDKINLESEFYSEQNIQDQNFLQDKYFYYEEGQEHVFKCIQQSVIEWIDAIQNISLLSSKETKVDQFFLEKENIYNYATIEDKEIITINLNEQTPIQISNDQEIEENNYKSKYKEAKEIINELRNQIEQQSQLHKEKLQEIALQEYKKNQENGQIIKNLQEEITQLQNQIKDYKTQIQNYSKSISIQQYSSNSQVKQQQDQPPINYISSQQQQQLQTQIQPIITPPPPPPPPPPPQTQNQISPPPPPPPPPPPQKIGESGSFPPPPPPPPSSSLIKGQNNQQQLQQLIRKQLPIPNKPMKPLFWTSVPDQKALKTIFEQIQNEDITLDTQFLEMNFYKSSSVQIKSENQIESGGKQQKIKLIQPERSQNIEIILSKLRLNVNVLTDALFQMNLQVLTESLVNSLIAICPTQEEVELLNDFTGDLSLLGQSELFIDALRKVNGFQFRIKALHFTYNYYDNKQTFLKDVKALTEAFINLKNSQELQIIILIVLRIGNFLNAKTSKGNVAAFKLEAIEKCSDLKSIDSQQNLLYYVIEKSEEILKGEVINLQLINKFEIIEKISLPQLQQNLNEFKKGQNLIQQSIESASDNPKDLIAIQFQPILNGIQEDFVQFQELFQTANKFYKECCEYYCENQQEQSDKFGEKIMKILRCLYKNKQERLFKIEKMRKEEESKLIKLNQSQQNEKHAIRSDKNNKTWVCQSQDTFQKGYKMGRESLVEKEIKEMQKFKIQTKFFK